MVAVVLAMVILMERNGERYDNCGGCNSVTGSDGGGEHAWK